MDVKSTERGVIPENTLVQMIVFFPLGTTQSGVIFLGITLINPQNLYGVIGGEMITPINSWKIKWWSVIQEVRMVTCQFNTPNIKDSYWPGPSAEMFGAKYDRRRFHRTMEMISALPC